MLHSVRHAAEISQMLKLYFNNYTNKRIFNHLFRPALHSANLLSLLFFDIIFQRCSAEESACHSRLATKEKNKEIYRDPITTLFLPQIPKLLVSEGSNWSKFTTDY